MKRQVTGILVILLFTAASANAASISYNDAFSFPLSPGNAAVNLPQFDPSLGTLTSVTLAIDATVQADITAENDSNIAGNMGVDLTGIVTATSGAASASANVLQSAGPVAVAASDGNPGSGPDFFDFGTISGTDSDTDTILSPLAPFIGLGTVAVAISGNGGFAVNGVTDSTLTVSNFGTSGTVTITYNYQTPVIPEPSSVVLAGMACMAGVLVLRRRNR